MGSIRWRITLTIMTIAVSVLSCSNDDNSHSSLPEDTSNTNGDTVSSEVVTITLGNFTDLTGVSANAMQVLTMALEDTVDYYNETNLIPGVNLEVVNYDGQYDQSKDVPGYHWLKDRGADVLWTPIASAAVTLKPFLEEDKTVLFTMSPTNDAIENPGWVFALGNASYDEQIFTLLDWIAENDPDFPMERPAKIGGAMFAESAGISMIRAAKEYVEANPDRYEWVAGFLTDFKFTWQSEVEALKDCDYVFPAIPPHGFVKDYRQMNGKGKFIGTDAVDAFMGQICDANLWEEMDGAYVIRPFRWWTDDTEYVRLTKQLLTQNHQEQAQAIIESGVGYITVMPISMLLDTVKATVEKVGAENFSSEALYDFLQSYSTEVDGCHHSFNETKRTSNDFLNVDRFDAKQRDLFVAHDGWLPVVCEP